MEFLVIHHHVHTFHSEVFVGGALVTHLQHTLPHHRGPLVECWWFTNAQPVILTQAVCQMTTLWLLLPQWIKSVLPHHFVSLVGELWRQTCSTAIPVSPVLPSFAFSYCFWGPTEHLSLVFNPSFSIWSGNYPEEHFSRLTALRSPLPDTPLGWIPAPGTEYLSYVTTQLMMLTRSPAVHILCSLTIDLSLAQIILICLLGKNSIVKE